MAERRSRGKAVLYATIAAAAVFLSVIGPQAEALPLGGGLPSLPNGQPLGGFPSTMPSTASPISSPAISSAPLGGAVLPGGGTQSLPLGIPSLPGAPIANTVSGAVQGTTRTLNNVIGNTASTIVRDTVGRPAMPKAFEQDIQGARVVRGEVIALSPTEQSLAAARNLNFEVLRQSTLASLGLSVAVLRTPDGMSVTDALAMLRKADPAGSYDYDHIYDPSGEREIGLKSARPGTPVSDVARIGMIDGGVDRKHPVFGNSSIESKTFAGSGSPLATAHGTAVASLLVGQDDDFHGALRGTTLYAADVYGGSPAGGSADAIANALAWLAAKDVPVVNISLAGPPNMLLAAATAAFLKRGHILVAAVGNDGPAAPQRYPAAYPGVVGVTSVDAQRQVQIDANRGADVAFAAEGINVRAATLDRRYASFTGTSFAAPIVAARFALAMDHSDSATAARAWTTLEHAAIDLGAPGRDPVFGYGYLDPPSTAMLANGGS